MELGIVWTSFTSLQAFGVAMSGRNNFAKAAFVSSAIMVGLFASSTAALAEPSQQKIAQVFDAQQVLEMTEAYSSAQDESMEDESEAAMLELAEALNADDVEEIVLPVETVAVDAGIESVVIAPIEEVKVPSAETLGTFESIGSSEISIETKQRDLSTANARFALAAEDMPALQAALQSNNPLTQLYAADTLWTLTGDRDLVLPTLIEAAVAGDEQAQAMAIGAIAQMGEDALPAVPVLNQLVKDARTRSIARDALTVVRSGNPSSAALGIVAREAQRRLLPAALRAITGLWR